MTQHAHFSINTMSPVVARYFELKKIAHPPTTVKFVAFSQNVFVCSCGHSQTAEGKTLRGMADDVLSNVDAILEEHDKRLSKYRHHNPSSSSPLSSPQHSSAYSPFRPSPRANTNTQFSPNSTFQSQRHPKQRRNKPGRLETEGVIDELIRFRLKSGGANSAGGGSGVNRANGMGGMGGMSGMGGADGARMQIPHRRMMADGLRQAQMMRKDRMEELGMTPSQMMAMRKRR
ncbi:uncharacterized protein MONOS_10450 [Monocercomonoides exilis]|uniref:uncharacterized protein n=1 Tax=Monocercomonoides exilis TaxID=2049356 RepID=UPI00355A046A|nr:hypothetical protein MONOS_10450 [Monocercomonoides exilis]|eukprot:MONOS_10450.1-p1 / transcript=MONOS_10450.1 / gene=MONOS_10450 / organism=Monocercomonoides_exilis_PA203 / gene_product=unspecified product / transcript_product=unspecified product / location=Mono_scaffold00476:16024-17369(+) / protein_length=231 / sequence_SO=supercontig / SO=protein_coding / is_pseudo=false